MLNDQPWLRFPLLFTNKAVVGGEIFSTTLGFTDPEAMPFSTLREVRWVSITDLKASEEQNSVLQNSGTL